MDAGSSCFCLLCHPSAKTCQFHYHASVTRMGHRPGLPETEKLCIYLRACLWKTKHNGSATTLSNKQMPVWFMSTPDRGKETVLRAQTCRKRIYISDPRSLSHTLTKTFVSTESLLMMGGSMMFVCVPKELALPLGPNQQPTAAGY